MAKRIYVVEDDEGWVYGVVAESPGKAKSIISEEFEIPYTLLTCRVRRDLDEYAKEMPIGHIEDKIWCLEHDICLWCEEETCPNCGKDGVDIFKDVDGKIRCELCGINPPWVRL